jgi:hypothetical protein
MSNFLYTFSSGSTETYELPGYIISAESFQGVSQASSGYIKSVYNINYQKIFAGTTNSSTGLTIYNSANTRTVISTSADTYGIAVDNTNDLVAIVNTSNGGPIDNVVVIVAASSNTVVNTVNVIDSYKGDIASDNNGYCYVVGGVGDVMTKVDIVNGVTADTINIGDGGVTNRKIIYNTNNNFVYTWTPTTRIRVWDPSGWGNEANINLTGNTSFFVFNPDKDYIYVGNVTGGTNDFVITTIRCANNTILSEKFIYSGAVEGGDTGVYGFYSTDTQYLYVGNTESDSILVLTT